LIERARGEVRYMQFALYEQFPELAHGIFTRHGGYSAAPYDELNVSVGSGDNFEHILRNRFLALQTLNLHAYRCASAWMIHSGDVAVVPQEGWDDWDAEWPYRSYTFENGDELHWTTRPRRRVDAMITRARGVTLVMSSADCVPLMLYDPVREVIALVHAGWRGTARGIAAATVDEMREQFGCRPADIRAGIGPSIGPCCYEVSEEVRPLFRGERDFEMMPTREQYRNLVRESAVFTVQELPERASLRLDLWQTNRKQLLMADLSPEHIESSDICTNCETRHFYSHRGEHGRTGRFPSILALHPRAF
jgi:YfiH family protein